MKQLQAIIPSCLKHKIGIHENTAPRTKNVLNYTITEEDIYTDLYEGRE